MKCDWCGKEEAKLSIDKIKHKVGQYCDWCLSEWDDYLDRKREDERMTENRLLSVIEKLMPDRVIKKNEEGE